MERHAEVFARFGKPRDPIAYEDLIDAWTGRPERAIATFEKAITGSGPVVNPIKPMTRVSALNVYQRYLVWAYWKAGRAADAQALYDGRPEDVAPSPFEVLALVERKRN